MSIRTLLVSAGLLIVCGAVSSQPQPNHPALPPLPGAAPPVAPPVPVPSRLEFFPSPMPHVVPTPPAPPPEKTVDELLTELERVQAQKAELEKKEQELKATVRKKLEQQAERLKKLGIAPAPAKEAEPDRVGRIIIEGNTKTPDQKILEKLELRPGQILQYPKLEDARMKLQKAGFREVTIEVVPGEADSHFKDVRVKVIEPPAAPGDN